VLFLSNFYFVKYKTFVSMGVSVFWSLAIEEQFYVFWPFIILKNNIKSVLIIMSVLLVGTLCAKYYLINDFTLGFDFNQFHTLCNLTGLIVGSLLAIAIIKNYILNLKLIVPLVVFVNLLNWYLPSVMLTEFWLNKSLYFTCELTAVLNTGLFICLLTKFDGLDFVKKLFSVKPMVFLGKISFGMYLYHQLVPKITLLSTYYGNSGLRFLILVVVCSVSYYIFERPVLNVGHKLINKIK
jgi:peptidoglycan/LPS O-acetylase OafA/YrhL